MLADGCDKVTGKGTEPPKGTVTLGKIIPGAVVLTGVLVGLIVRAAAWLTPE